MLPWISGNEVSHPDVNDIIYKKKLKSICYAAGFVHYASAAERSAYAPGILIL